MKTTSLTIFLGVMICLTSRSGPLYGQAVDISVEPSGDDKPWNHGVSAENRHAARALFLDGNRLFRVPLFARAAEKYQAALRTWEHPAFYFNLALAYLNLGEDLKAHKALELTLQHGESPLGAEQFQEARKQLLEVEQRLGRLRIRCQVNGAKVTMDGAALFIGPGSYEGWADVKVHEITAQKPEYLPETRRVTVSAGRHHDLDLKMITLDEAADTGRRWVRWKPWAVVATGAAVLVGGVSLHAISARNFQAYDGGFLMRDCVAHGCSKAEIGQALNDQLNHAVLQQQIAVSGYIAGSALVMAGFGLVYLNRPKLPEQRASRSLTKEVAIAPLLSADMVGVVFDLRY